MLSFYFHIQLTICNKHYFHHSENISWQGGVKEKNYKVPYGNHKSYFPKRNKLI
jgi:hypothetical protein